MNKIFLFALCFFLVFCSKTQKKSTYVYTHNSKGALVRTEMRNGSATGRIIIYGIDGGIKVIMHIQDSVLTGKTYSFYDNGSISRIASYGKGWEEGRRYDFYKNNQIASIITYKKDKKYGPASAFYPDGGIQTRTTYFNDQATGDFLDFYAKPKNCIRRRVQYCLVRGKQYGNGHIDYDPDGKIIKRVGQLDILFDKKNYSMADSINMIIQLTGPRFNRISATVADFDAGFNGNDSTSGRTFYGRNHAVRLMIRPKLRGLNYVRGYVTDYDSTASILPGTEYEIKEKNVYFQRSYTVR